MGNKRLSFKFYKSYFDVASELQDKDRLRFYDAVMNRQFFGIEPKLSGLPRLMYISQKHSIDAQIKGWEDYFKTQLSDNHAMIGGMIGGMTEEQEEEEEKEEEETITCLTFDEFWEMYDKKVGKQKCEDVFKKTTEVERKLIIDYIPKYKESKPDVTFRKDPERFLKHKVWNDEIIQSQSNAFQTFEPPTTPTERPDYVSESGNLIDLSKIKWQ